MALAFVMITAEIGKEGEVLSELKKIEQAKEASLAYGVYDIVAKVEAETWKKLEEAITSKIRRVISMRDSSSGPSYRMTPQAPQKTRSGNTAASVKDSEMR